MPRIEYAGRRLHITHTEMIDIIDASEGLEKQALWAFLYLFGTRISEALHLTKDDFEIKDGLLYAKTFIEKQRKGKTVIPPYHYLCVPIDAPFASYIISHLMSITPGEKIWDVSRTTVRDWLRKVSPSIWPHLFRHTRLQKMADKGASAAELQSWAGWERMTSAQSYIQRSPEMVRKLAERKEVWE